MIAGKRLKSTEEKLNKTQLDAIDAVADNDYWPIMRSILACDKAIDNVLANDHPALDHWRHRMIAHYTEIGSYLISKMENYLLRDALLRSTNHFQGR